MNNEDKASLQAAAPKFFRGAFDPTATPPSPLTQRGFEIGHGWVSLVCSAGAAIEDIINQLSEEDQKRTHCTQCKEKFGLLRVYYRFPPGRSDIGDRIEAIIDVATAQSGETCESCGKAGRLINPRGGWMYVSCSPCLQKDFEEKIKEATRVNDSEWVAELTTAAKKWAENFDQLAEESDYENQDL